MELPKIKKKVILDNKIYLFVFDTEIEMNSTLMRFAEISENSEIIPSHEEFIINFVKNSAQKVFSYFSEWSGFCFSSDTIHFIRKFNSEFLWEREKQFLSISEDIPRKADIIAICKDKKNFKFYLRHEVHHSLYSLYPDYKEKIDEIMVRFKKNRKLFGVISRTLRKMGYKDEILVDEISAYSKDFGREIFKKLIEVYNKKELEKVNTKENRKLMNLLKKELVIVFEIKRKELKIRI